MIGDNAPLTMSPEAYRDAMVGALRRSLFGPPHHDDMSWPGQRNASMIDAGLRLTEFRPVGPWTAPDGQEVLSVRPNDLYITGTLAGAGGVAEGPVDVLDETALEVDRDVEQLAQPEIDETDAADLSDEIADDAGVSIEQRSVSMSFRVPNSTISAGVSVSFAHYEMFDVDGQQRPWWHRRPHTVVQSLSLAASSEQVLTSGAHQLSLGAVVRPSPEGRLCTVWVRNDTPGNPDFARIYQVELAVEIDALLPYGPGAEPDDGLDLLYRDVEVRAVGHGCDVDVVDTGTSCTLRSAAVPVVDVEQLTPDVSDQHGKSYAVGMGELADMTERAVSGIDRLIADYSAWVEERRREAADLDGKVGALAVGHVTACEAFLASMRSGWVLVQSDAEVRQCLADASRAMRSQRIAYDADVRPVTIEKSGAVNVTGVSPHNSVAREPAWRPFQIAFIIASLSKVVDADDPGRQSVDVIWMPTGGGKTEAYLGLAAFTILWERRQQLLGTKKGRAQGNVKVYMRYTLRLLTVQQLVRSASLVCALERIRVVSPDRYGKHEVRLGAWLGNATTPGTRKDAITLLERAKKAKSGTPSGFLLSRCPWCSAEMGAGTGGSVIGYHAVKLPTRHDVKRLLPACPDPTCPFTRRDEAVNGRTVVRGLPVIETDEDLYDFPPDFVIGTIDKVATMWMKPQSQALFGLVNGKREAAPPALFIQDELHLISGPLGSLDAVFEAMLEHLCSFGDGGSAPVYVASTATTKSYEAQIDGLYARAATLVPPPGLTIDDSFFARRSPALTPRRYVAVSASEPVPNAAAQARVLGVLAHFASALEDAGATVDPYWTNVAFFSSRRSLGLLTTTTETSLYSFMSKLHSVSGAFAGQVGKEGRSPRRSVRRAREITATAAENVSQVLDDLGIRYPADGAIDLCFATSMIEVGLDVPRLGLMTIMGQPKSGSQYIQVSGRVGRSSAAPALVVDVLGARNPRDRSHFEGFTGWHRRLYASVESASVTPYTEQALRRSLPTVMAILCQILGTGANVQDQILSVWDPIAEVFRARAARFGKRNEQVTSVALDRLRDRARHGDVRALVWSSWLEPSTAFALPFGVDAPPGRPTAVWHVLTSMRSVDPDAVGSFHAPLTAEVFESEIGTAASAASDGGEVFL
jgi:enamine deaminase RidA (YjgF/YER057c/UK114 family)